MENSKKFEFHKYIRQETDVFLLNCVVFCCFWYDRW